MAQEYIKNAFPGAIFLFHDGGRHREKTLAALKIVIPALEQKGYHFVAAGVICLRTDIGSEVMKFFSIFFLVLGMESWALAYVPGHFYFQGHPDDKTIALTFDDGPGPITPSLLAFS